MAKKTKKAKTKKKKQICKITSQDILQPGARGINITNSNIPGYRK